MFYHSTETSITFHGEILRVPTSGGTIDTVAASADWGGGSYNGMLVIGGTLYFGKGYFGCVATVPIAGGTATCRASLDGGLQAYHSFATDGTSLYMIAKDFSVESVWRFPLDFSGATELASNTQWYLGDQPRLLLLDAQSVFYPTVACCSAGTPTGLQKRAK